MKMWYLRGWSCVQEGPKAAPFLSPTQPPATWGPLVCPQLTQILPSSGLSLQLRVAARGPYPALARPQRPSSLPRPVVGSCSCCPVPTWSAFPACLSPQGQDTTVPMYLVPSIPCHPQILPRNLACQGCLLLSKEHCFSSLG